MRGSNEIIDLLFGEKKVDVLSVVNQIIKYLKEMQGAFKAKDQKLFTEYIEKVFDNTEMIYNDFREILYTAMTQINNGVPVQEVVKYLHDKRRKLISTRIKIRSEIRANFFEFPDFQQFYIYVCGVLQGGMNGNVEERIKRDIMPDEKLEELTTASLEHTIVDLIQRCENNILVEYDKAEKVSIIINNTFHDVYLDKHYAGWMLNERNRLAEDFEHQIWSIDEYWKKLSYEYAKLKQKIV